MKKKRKIVWQLFPWYLSLVLIAFSAVIWYTRGSVYHFFLDRTRTNLEIQARLLETVFKNHLVTGDLDSIRHLCREFGRQAPTRITVILPDGRVGGDSDQDPAAMERHLDRPEIVQAFQTGYGTAARYSRTIRREMMYVAVSLMEAGQVVGVLRTAIPLTDVQQIISGIQIKITVGGLGIALAAALISLIISRRITRPIEEITAGALRFAGGELSHRLHSPRARELSELADAMNTMARQLKERMAAVITQRNEYEAVLASMREGVIAVDSHDQLISINQAALDILGIDRAKAEGRTIPELIRSRDLAAYVTGAVSGRAAQDKDVEIQNEQRRIINMRSTPLMDAQANRIGLLLVVNDVTRVRHLERMRRDFVANVSHESKTPLTAIKGIVETLANHLRDDPENAARFIAIIARHVDRLNSIIDDLLSLSRIEQMDETEHLRQENRRLRHVVESAADCVRHKATSRNIHLDIQHGQNVCVRVDVTLFEQALVNLIDNAVVYSPPESTVHIETALNSDGLRIAVRDHGAGIAQKHLPRLFERFYRVDNSRSRNAGGTGLGLAIVKHVMQVHGGSVSVDSTPGVGSTFGLHLPLRRVADERDGNASESK